MPFASLLRLSIAIATPLLRRGFRYCSGALTEPAVTSVDLSLYYDHGNCDAADFGLLLE